VLDCPVVKDLLPVASDGVWQKAQPTPANNARPRAIDGVSGIGVGGAVSLMNIAKFSVSE
jgi:hypothetical protein